MPPRREAKRQFRLDGWRSADRVDLRFEWGDDYTPATCEKCSRSDLRIIHAMYNDITGEKILVGRKCAANLDLNYDSRDAERRLLSKFKSWQLFLTKGWTINDNGHHVRKYKGFTVTVFPSPYHPSHLNYSIDRKGWKRPQYGNGRFDTKDQAAIAAFDKLVEMLP